MKSLYPFINKLEENGLLNEACIINYEIGGISDNSKHLKPGDLFVCKGRYFKAAYLADAVSEGAVCYMAEKEYAEGLGISRIIVNDIRKAMIMLAAWFCDHPSEDMEVVGITGTKGKTTVTHLIKSALDVWDMAETGKPCGLMSTIEMFDGEKTVKSINTTPEPIELNMRLRKMADTGLRHCALEVSSQALRYGRTDGIRFRAGAFLALRRDHIRPVEHKHFEDYYTAKLKLFDQSGMGIVDLDAELSDRTLAYAAEKTGCAWTYSLKDESADFYAHDIYRDGGHTVFRVKSPHFAPGEEDQEFRIAMPGLFNVSNAAAVIAVCTALGEPAEHIREGIADLKIAGHMEVFTSRDGNIVAVADYAHNKLSYEALFDAVQAEYPEHYENLRVVFGSVGDKAEQRREELGTVAGRRAKKSYICADEPGHEPFSKIASEIARFVELQNGDYEIIEDRGEAIEKAFSDADGKTAILACGFGRLTVQRYNGEFIPIESDVDCIIRLIEDYDRSH